MLRLHWTSKLLISENYKENKLGYLFNIVNYNPVFCSTMKIENCNTFMEEIKGNFSRGRQFVCVCVCVCVCMHTFHLFKKKNQFR